MNISEGMEYNEYIVYKLHKALYDLKQAPRVANQVFDEFVISVGLRQS